MTRLSYPAGGVFLAAFVAGPIFIITALLSYQLTSQSETVTSDALAMSIAFVFFAMIPGFILAILPCLIGSALMTWASTSEFGQARLSWVAVGALTAGLPSIITGGDIEGISALSFVVTGGICALICRCFAEEQA
jgi:predicted anti-sigma-YlaC factor YlaD